MHLERSKHRHTQRPPDRLIDRPTPMYQLANQHTDRSADRPTAHTSKNSITDGLIERDFFIHVKMSCRKLKHDYGNTI